MASGSTTVTVFTDRPLFEAQWLRALAGANLQGAAAEPSELPAQVVRGQALIIDAEASGYDEDELLAHVGLARAVGAIPVVALPLDTDISTIDDLVDDLCRGLVARRDEDVNRIAMTLSRRAEAKGALRFEYLTVSPRGGELLAIFSDGGAGLVKRPVAEQDDGSEIASIDLENEATEASLTLQSGVQFKLKAGTLSHRAQMMGRTGGNDGEVDGIKLGKRIRELRLAAGLTQAELARRTGIHRPNIARVEAGRHTPSLETLARLASAIGVPTTLVLE